MTIKLWMQNIGWAEFYLCKNILAALAFAEFNAKYPDDKRYEQISLLIAEATVEYAPKDFICKILIQTFDSIDNPSTKFIKRINQLKYQILVPKNDK